jgi:hypothetical protein
MEKRGDTILVSTLLDLLGGLERGEMACLGTALIASATVGLAALNPSWVTSAAHFGSQQLENLRDFRLKMMEEQRKNLRVAMSEGRATVKMGMEVIEMAMPLISGGVAGPEAGVAVSLMQQLKGKKPEEQMSPIEEEGVEQILNSAEESWHTGPGFTPNITSHDKWDARMPTEITSHDIDEHHDELIKKLFNKVDDLEETLSDDMQKLRDKVMERPIEVCNSDSDPYVRKVVRRKSKK